MKNLIFVLFSLILFSCGKETTIKEVTELSAPERAWGEVNKFINAKADLNMVQPYLQTHLNSDTTGYYDSLKVDLSGQYWVPVSENVFDVYQVDSTSRYVGRYNQLTDKTIPVKKKGTIKLKPVVSSDKTFIGIINDTTYVFSQIDSSMFYMDLTGTKVISKR